MKLIVSLIALVMMISFSSVFANSNQLYQNELLIIQSEDYLSNSNNELEDKNISTVAYQTGPSSRYFSSSGSEYREATRTRFPKNIKPQGHRIFFFSPKLQAWAAYDADGVRVGYGKANGGSHWCEELGSPCRTPYGKFRVHTKGTESCKSRKFPLPKGGAPMPYCMYFLGGYAIHGSPGISNNNSSHGCIRVYTQAAHWLSNNFINVGTQVVVLSY